jgi:hypothetical protein
MGFLYFPQSKPFCREYRRQQDKILTVERFILKERGGFVADFSSLLALIRLIQKGRQLGSSDVAGLLYSLNSAELRAALQALADAGQSLSPHEETEQALAILRGTYEKSMVLASDYGVLKQLATMTPVVGWLFSPRFLKAGEEAIACSMLVLLHYSANNQAAIVLTWIGKLDAAVAVYHKRYILYRCNLATSASAPVAASLQFRDDAKQKAEQEFEQLKRELDLFKSGLTTASGSK